MSHRVLVEIEGVSYPLEECEWVWLRKCGCPFACSHADSADEEHMWREVFHYAEVRTRHRRNGVTAELMTRARAKEEILPKMSGEYTCPHT